MTDLTELPDLVFAGLAVCMFGAFVFDLGIALLRRAQSVVTDEAL